MTKNLLITSAIAALLTISGVAGVQAKGKHHSSQAMMGKCFKDMDKKEELKAKDKKECEKQKGHWEEMKEEKEEMMKEKKED